MRLRNRIPDTYWVWPRHLMAGEYPGAWDSEDVRPKVRWFLEQGITAFIDLTQAGELEPYRPILVKESFRLDVEPTYVRKPIRDMGTPTRDEMVEILDTIDEAVQAGRLVYAHCLAGLGRTGVVAGCYLVRKGLTGVQALERIPIMRRGLLRSDSPQTNAQRRMVLEWAE